MSLPVNTIELIEEPSLGLTILGHGPVDHLTLFVNYFVGFTDDSGYTRQSGQQTYTQDIAASPPSAHDDYNVALGAIASLYGMNLAASWFDPAGNIPAGQGTGTDTVFYNVPGGSFS